MKTAAEEKELKAYSVFDSEHETGCICFAYSAGDAKSLAFGSEALEGIDYTDLRATRCKKADKYAARFGSGTLGFETANDRLYRELGWWGVDSSLQCVWCELHEFDSIPESKLTETEDGDYICQECLEQENKEKTAAEEKGIALNSNQQAAAQNGGTNEFIGVRHFGRPERR